MDGLVGEKKKGNKARGRRVTEQIKGNSLGENN
jgi:hypothetical protein